MDLIKIIECEIHFKNSICKEDNMENKSQRLNTTIKAVADILEKNKNNKSVKEAYADISKLKEKRNIN